MFFLPSPMNRILETLEQVQSAKTTLPDPELFINVNGTPTKNKVVWRTLVDVNKVVEKLKQINWLYKGLAHDAVDNSTKQVIEVVNSTTSTMLEKADESDMAGFQAYTVRSLENKLPTVSNIDQYKVLSVHEYPLDSRQLHLDLMCFPALYPTGAFGENHVREVNITHSEYVKSRLLNRDSSFRKDPQYVFYLLWKKELRELSAGIYNMLKNTRRQSTSVSTLFNQVACSNKQLEGNLCTMLQVFAGPNSIGSLDTLN